jgi:DNA-binding IclR family transcriptional regulator
MPVALLGDRNWGGDPTARAINAEVRPRSGKCFPHAGKIPAVGATRRDSVQSLERAFDLLEALAAEGELGVTELAARTGLVPSTAHRLLATLAKRGYVTQGSLSGRYLLGYKVIEVASGLEHRLPRLRAVARPHLERIQRATGETTNLVVLDGERVVYVDQIEGSHSVRMFTVVGTAALAHTTASGKAIMAYGRPELAMSLYADREPLERLTPRTLVTFRELQEDFARIRRRGYAIDNEEHEEGVGCVAAPLFDHTGAPCAAISVSGPSARIVHADTTELGALLSEHGTMISEALGYRRPPAAVAG